MKLEAFIDGLTSEQKETAFKYYFQRLSLQDAKWADCVNPIELDHYQKVQTIRQRLELPCDQDPKYEKHIKVPSKQKVVTHSKKRTYQAFAEDKGEPLSEAAAGSRTESKKIRPNELTGGEIEELN